MNKKQRASSDALTLLRKGWRTSDHKVAVCECEIPNIISNDPYSCWLKCECGGWISCERLTEKEVL